MSGVWRRGLILRIGPRACVFVDLIDVCFVWWLSGDYAAPPFAPDVLEL